MKWIALLMALCALSTAAPVTYPVPGGNAYLSDQGKAAVDPGTGLQTFNFPAMGMYQDKFIPIAVDAMGELVITGIAPPGSSNVNVHDFAGTGISSTLIGGKNGLDVNVINSITVANFPATQDVNVTNSTLAVTQSGAWTVAATQSGPWTTGRTWTLSSGSDSVSASVSNFPALQQVDIEDILGSAPSVTNYLPTRISNGTSYVDPTQIRALTSGTDSITAFQGGSWTVTANAGTGTMDVNVTNASIPVTQSGTWTVQQGTPPWSVSQSGAWTTGRTWTLSSGTDSVTTPAIGLNGATAPASSGEVGGVDPVTGNLVSVSARALNSQVVATDTGLVTNAVIHGLTTGGGGGYVDVKVNPSGALTVAASQDTSPWVVSGTVSVSGTVAVTQSTSPWVVSGTVTSNQGTPNTIANSWPVEVTDGASNILGTATHPLRVDPTGTTTQPVSGTVTANQGGSWTVAATQSGTWTTGRTWTLASGTDSVASVQSGTWTVQQGTPPWSVSQSGTWTVQQGTPPWTIQGDSASGAAKAGNPVQTGGVFNTTQPTVTTGQTVESQSTARGAQIVATGVDAFNVNATQTTSPWVVSGTVTANQGTSPWVNNVSQFGGSNVVTGTGASGSGIPRVTVSNDSNVLATQSGTWTVQQGSPPWQVVGNVASGASDSGNPAKTAAVFNTTLPTVTNGQRVDNQADSNGRQIVTNAPRDGVKSTYSAAVFNLATAASATDIFTITGSASKTVRITRIGISGISSSTNNFVVRVIKRSTANSGGTSSAVTAVPHDSTDSAATATVLSYTANPTLGTAVGDVRTERITFTANNTNNSQLELDFGNGPEKAIVLSGTSQVLALNLNGVSVASSSLDLYLEWTEE